MMYDEPYHFHYVFDVSVDVGDVERSLYVIRIPFVVENYVKDATPHVVSDMQNFCREILRHGIVDAVTESWFPPHQIVKVQNVRST